jgi:hypothetical protein
VKKKEEGGRRRDEGRQTLFAEKLAAANSNYKCLVDYCPLLL